MKSHLPKDCGFFNGLVTVWTDICDWLRIKIRQSNDFEEPSRLPWETKPTITFLKCSVFSKMLLCLKCIYIRMSAIVNRGQLMES